MVASSVAEVVSIGSLLPFLTALTAPEELLSQPIIGSALVWIGAKNSSELVFIFTAAFCSAALISGATRLLLLWATTKISFDTGADLSLAIYKRTLYQPYSVHTSRNSSEIVDAITSKSNMLIYQVVLPILSGLSSGLIMFVILVALISINPLIFISAFVCFFMIYVCIARLTKNKLMLNGVLIANKSIQSIKAVQEGLGGIRDILIDGSQEIYCRAYQESDLALRRAQGENQFAASSPRFILEGFGMIVIAILAYYLAKNTTGFSSAIPVLGVIALGTQRILPLLQQIYNSWASVKGSQETLKDSLRLLNQPMPVLIDATSNAMEFNHSIELSEISFRYFPGGPWVIERLSFKIQKGERLGVIGKTGGGKSTFIDIIMALLSPTSGSLKVDEKVIDESNSHQWQRRIAHVPQSIYLADSTSAENIAFGVPFKNIDFQRVERVASLAQIAEVIESWPERYMTMVGERGSRLSGGQRQRIGIARALYKKADVIIFDEATSALDGGTEKLLMEAVDDLGSGLTIIMIAHRLSTLKNCSRIIELGAGSIKQAGSYQEILER
jgi:ATP-binding cassette subfamily B protein